MYACMYVRTLAGWAWKHIMLLGFILLKYQISFHPNLVNLWPTTLWPPHKIVRFLYILSGYVSAQVYIHIFVRVYVCNTKMHKMHPSDIVEDEWTFWVPWIFKPSRPTRSVSSRNTFQTLLIHLLRLVGILPEKKPKKKFLKNLFQEYSNSSRHSSPLRLTTSM